MRHKDEIRQQNKVDVIAINESNLNKKTADDTIAIDNSILKCLDRNEHSGGVTIYIRKMLNFEHRVDFPMGHLEATCIEVKPKCSEPFLIVAWYRQPKYELITGL